MTIEKEASHNAKNIEVRVHPLGEIIACKLFSFERCPPEEQKRMVQRCFKAAIEYHDKDLQAKQDRILELEEKVREYKWEWESACERERATNERVKELEHLLHGHSDDVLRTVFQKIKRLEDALFRIMEIPDDVDLESDPAGQVDEMCKRAKKAIGGGNELNT